VKELNFPQAAKWTTLGVAGIATLVGAFLAPTAYQHWSAPKPVFSKPAWGQFLKFAQWRNEAAACEFEQANPESKIMWAGVARNATTIEFGNGVLHLKSGDVVFSFSSDDVFSVEKKSSKHDNGHQDKEVITDSVMVVVGRGKPRVFFDGVPDDADTKDYAEIVPTDKPGGGRLMEFRQAWIERHKGEISRLAPFGAELNGVCAVWTNELVMNRQPAFSQNNLG
jgi:hypothetical protein